ncbi:hypothetical protein BV898_18420 [Hypsibius exemplaris]|uniref:Uncharacterized protein n=1 Tax=Hypsibius exemplaris TaxID=2072580 RepID=A0A9X6NH64_HYPEX|nr:hypothetical protein BV898_18420 [Hypsibius exemplaris]
MFLANGIIPQKQIMNGTKIMQMDICINLRIRCSYRQIPLKLIDLPAAFDLKDVIKGNFPHRFNRPKNWNRITPFPSKDDFGYRGLSALNNSIIGMKQRSKLRRTDTTSMRSSVTTDTIHPIRQVPYENVYQDTKERTRGLRDQGCDVEKVWEHDFKRLLKNNKEMQTFIKDLVFEEQIRVPNQRFEALPQV